MEHDYIFWADLFDTYQSLEPGVQLAWLAALFALGLSITLGTTRILELLLTRRGDRRRGDGVMPSSLGGPGLYRVKTDENGLPYLEPVGEVPLLDWEKDVGGGLR